MPCGKGIVWFTVYVMTRERVTGAIVCGRTLAYRVGPLKTKRVINRWKKAYRVGIEKKKLVHTGTEAIVLFIYLCMSN